MTCQEKEQYKKHVNTDRTVVPFRDIKVDNFPTRAGPGTLLCDLRIIPSGGLIQFYCGKPGNNGLSVAMVHIFVMQRTARNRNLI